MKEKKKKLQSNLLIIFFLALMGFWWSVEVPSRALKHFNVNKIMEAQLSLLSYLLHMTATEKKVVRPTRTIKLTSNFKLYIRLFLSTDEHKAFRADAMKIMETSPPFDTANEFQP